MQLKFNYNLNRGHMIFAPSKICAISLTFILNCLNLQNKLTISCYVYWIYEKSDIKYDQKKNFTLCK